MEIFHQCFQYTPLNLLILLNVVFFYIYVTFLADKYLKMMFLIDICTLLCKLFFFNAKVCIYSLADLNIGHCVELAFLEGKLG